MKILYIIGQLGRGGAEQQLYYLLKYLRPDARVISLRQNDYWAEPIRALGIEVTELKRRGRADFSRLFEIVRIMRQYKPDIVHIFIDTPYALYGRIATILTRQRCVVIGVRAHPRLNPTWYSRLCWLWLNRHSAAIVANSREAYDYLLEIARQPKRKLRFIPNGLELDRFAIDAQGQPALLPGEWSGKPVIGVVASLTAVKAPQFFVKAAERVFERHTDARFIWIGDGELQPQVEQQRDQSGLGNVFLLPGQQTDIPRWLAALDIFVLTSTLEGLSNAVMEAMSAGLPCVVTDVGGNRELVQEGVTGFRVATGDVEAMCDRICRLIDDAELRRSMGAAGQTAIQAYGAHTMAEAYGHLYDSLMPE